MGTPELTGHIRRWGAELGLLRVGIAPLAIGRAAERFTNWLSAGYHGEMGYLPRRKAERADPEALLSGARSAIVASEAYAPPHGDVFAELADGTRGYFARYARGADYHERLKARLTALAERITENSGARCRVCVDTAPVLEKDFGVLAGLGWRGKHTNLVDPKGGNWIFLGVVLTDLDLPGDTPVPDRCGTCTRCLDVCPTDAFPAPYVLDARRCISYLTIELKGPIPRSLRPAIGNRVFGCDDCLAVCPWNRFAAEAHDAAYAAREITSGVPLAELLSLTPRDFNRLFRHTPIHRTRRRGLLRNVAVALGNSGDGSAVPALARALADAEPLIRGHAAWALGRIGGSEAGAALRDAPANDADPWVAAEIAAARSPS